MVNNYSKMRRSNQIARKWLEQHNYINIHLFPHTRWIKDVNIDNLAFDGLATNHKKLVLFQVKSNCKPSKKLVEEFKRLNEKYGIECLWFNVVDRKGVEIYP